MGRSKMLWKNLESSSMLEDNRREAEKELRQALCQHTKLCDKTSPPKANAGNLSTQTKVCKLQEKNSSNSFLVFGMSTCILAVIAYLIGYYIFRPGKLSMMIF